MQLCFKSIVTSLRLRSFVAHEADTTPSGDNCLLSHDSNQPPAATSERKSESDKAILTMMKAFFRGYLGKSLVDIGHYLSSSLPAPNFGFERRMNRPQVQAK